LFDRVMIRATDREAAERFYGTVLRTLGVEQTSADARDARWGEFVVRHADDRSPPTRGLHIGFAAPTRGRVDEFWRTGTAAGYRDDGQPGLRPQYGPDYYGGFLLDPDGNSAEAVHHDLVRERGLVDHLWIRVGDLAAAKRFYVAAAPYTGFPMANDAGEPERVQFAGTAASFSVVAGEQPSEHVYMSFAADGDEAVDAFHDALAGAGRGSVESPAERVGEEGRAYAAVVLDPDGNSVELVHHGPA
jgi:catechol 2,3-dioxygenase-like lactoylglutathione lyase family enzyme